jgi:hypothetical protein
VTNLRGTITGVTPVAGTTNQFDIKFRSQTALGIYSLTFGPDILDRSHRPMDQNHNLIAGEGGDTDDRQGEQDDSERRHDTDGADTYTATFVIQGLRVNASALDSNVPGVAHVVHLTFNEPVAVSSLTTAAVSLSGPDGAHAALGVVPTNADNTQFDVMFAPLTRVGTYTVTVQPTVSDLFGHLMDQDGNLIPGESTDAYTAALAPLVGPRVTGATAGTERPVSHVIVTFDRPMDPSSFSTGSFALAGPSGNAIAVTAAAAVPDTNGTQFEVDFAPNSALGRYTLTVHAGVADIYGNVLAADAATTLTVNYTAAATAFQNIEIFGQAGTQTLTFTSGMVTADDDFGTINLGSNSFTFFGQTYTQLFVSSNGLITFGSGNASVFATSLAGSPAQAAIAVYWTDLFKSGTEPMIVWRIDGNQLIIEWYRVTTFSDRTMMNPPRMTFQAILQLNTGGAPGDIVLNYSSVTGTGDGPENIGVTVGVKDAGTASDIARTLVEDGTRFSSTGSPLVQSGKAVRITAS